MSAKNLKKCPADLCGLTRTFADVFQLDEKHDIVSPPKSAGFCVCPRKNVSQADVSGHSRTFVDSIRECLCRTVRRRGSRTICCGRSWTVTMDFSRGHSRTTLRGRAWTVCAEIRGLFRGHSQTIVRRRSRTFSHRHSRIFPVDIRIHLYPFLWTFADILRLLLWTFEDFLELFSTNF